MSYLRASKVEQHESAAVEYGFALAEINFEDEPTIDVNLDDEQLKFVLELVALIDELPEGEAIVVWKELF